MSSERRKILCSHTELPSRKGVVLKYYNTLELSKWSISRNNAALQLRPSRRDSLAVMFETY